MSASVFIYGLTDPRTGEIRYVGSTKDLAARAAQHRYSSRDVTGRGDFNGSGRHKNEWLRSLRELFLSPGLDVLAVTTADDRDRAEREWIRRLFVAGLDLTNEIPAHLKKRYVVKPAICRQSLT